MASIGKATNRQIIFIAAVSEPGSAGVDPHTYNALMDTGAQQTMVSEKVIQEVGLQAIGHINIVPVTGAPVPTEKYRVRLDIPIASAMALPGGRSTHHEVRRGMDLEVGKLFYSPTNHDILVGMDFLSAFHITMYADNFILSN